MPRGGLDRRADSAYAAVAATHATIDHPIQRLRTVSQYHGLARLPVRE
jgi:hypothetical protein